MSARSTATRFVAAQPSPDVSRAAGHASKSRVMMKEMFQGVYSRHADVARHVDAVVSTHHLQRSIVEARAAAVAGVHLPVNTLIQILHLAARSPFDPAYVNDIRELSNAVLFGPVALPTQLSASAAAAATPTASASAAAAAPATRTAARAVSRVSMSHALTVAQLECVLSAVTHYRLVDRAFLVFEHAVHAGIAPTAPMITSMLHAAALKCAGRPAHEVHDTYAAALQLIAASGVRIDNEIACGLLGLLLDEAHTPAFRHLKSVAADRALPLPVAAEAATTATAASEPLLKEAFKLVAHLTDAELTHGRVLPLLMTLCMRHGRRDRALQLLGSMQARGVHIPTRCFNQLILSDGVSSMESVSVYLRLMADMGITPTEDTLLALVKVRMYAHGSKGGSVEFAQQLSAALHVPLDSRALGTIAFYALNCGALGDVNECMQAVATLPREAGAPPPRWMRKLSSLLAARLAQSTAAVRSKDRA